METAPLSEAATVCAKQDCISECPPPDLSSSPSHCLPVHLLGAFNASLPLGLYFSFLKDISFDISY